jgi:cystathionine beta-lyase/cystathionine gamma-synthase
MSREAKNAPETVCVRSARGRGDGASLVPPLVQSTTFVREGLESRAVHRYSRESNPTVAALEAALADLEGAPPAVAYSTGLAAETGLFQTLLSAGDHVVCSRAVYGGTTRLLQKVLARFGIAATFVDTRDLELLAAAIRPETKLLFLETPANPTLDLTDVRAACAIARRAGVLSAVDNTFLTAVLQRPLDLGADFSVYSTTKFVDGHSAALGGAIVGRDEAVLAELRFVRKCTGTIQTPFNAWLTIQGLKTLPLRIRKQSENAAAIAERLTGIEDVARVCYPTLLDSALAERQHLGGAHGAVVSFELDGGYDQARALLRHVELCTLVEHVGSVETLLTHSASMTHGGVSPEERAAAGVSEGLLRLSVGLEDPREVLADLERAIRKSREEVASCATI